MVYYLLMTYVQLQRMVKTEVFTILDVLKLFPNQSEQLARVQLSRFFKRGLVVNLKRGLYCFADQKIDPFIVANQLYTPSYISLETALNYHGVIPDVPLAGITSISPVTTRKFVTPIGTYYYQKVSQKLFWGYSERPFKIAFAEKALLDYEYFYGRKSLSSLRVDWTKVDRKKYTEFRKYYD